MSESGNPSNTTARTFVEIANTLLKSQFSISFQDDGDDPILALTYAEYMSLNGSIGLIGPRSSIACVYLANLPIPYISYGATSHALSNRSQFPNFFRTIPSDSTQADAVTDFLYLYGLNDSAILYSNEFYGNGAMNDTKQSVSLKGLTISKSISFNVNDTASIRSSLQILSSASVIVVWSFSPSDMVTILQEAKSLGMKNGNYLFIFTETFTNIPVQDVTSEDIFDGIVFCKYGTPLWDKSLYLDQEVSKLNDPSYKYYKFAYDALMAYHFALKLEGSSLKEKLFKVDFIGSTGRVRFDSNGDRIDNLYELVNVFGGNLTNLAKWSNTDGILNFGKSIQLTSQSLDLVSLSSPLQTNRWRNPISPPKAIFDMSMCVDEENDKIYVFGGTDLRNFYSDLYVYDIKERNWRVITPQNDGPSARYGAMMFFLDSKLILYGGFDNQAYFDETWEFYIPTQRWKLLDVVSPSPGTRYNMGYIKSGRIVYVFAGEDSTHLNSDLWSYDHDKRLWKLLSTGQVPIRISPCMEINENTLLTHGGKSSASIDINDFWTFDLVNQTWTLLKQTGDVPLARYGHSCWMTGSKFYMGMGWTDNYDINPDLLNYNDFYTASVNSTHVSWHLFAIPENHQPRYAQRLIEYQSYVVWMGGWGDSVFNSMWKLNIFDQLFVEVHPDIISPPALASHTSVIVAGSMIVFGGIAATGEQSSRLYQYNINDRIWSLRQTSTVSPDGVTHHCAVGGGTRMLVYGGFTENYEDAIWEYSLVENGWNRIVPVGSAPSGRSGHTCWLEDSGNKMFVFGGRSRNQVYSELWSFDLLTYRWEQVVIKNVDQMGKSLYSVRHARIGTNSILFYGGEDINGVGTPLIWELQIETLQLTLFYTLPLVLTGSSIVSTNHNSVLIFGGSSPTGLENTMYIIDYNGISTSIRNLDSRDITIRDSHTITYYGDELYIFGGYGPLIGKNVKQTSRILNDFTVYKFGPVCKRDSCWSCGPSTYIENRQCVKCPTGTWSNSFDDDCTPCPAGFFSPILGASDYRICQPCDFGTYQPRSGSDSCLICPMNMTCLIGSVTPEKSSLQLLFDPIFHQPIPLQTDEIASTLNNITIGMAIAIGVVSAVMIFIMLCFCSRAMLKFLDLCETDHPPIKFKKATGRIIRAFRVTTNWIGGVFTVLFPIVVIGLLVILISQPIIDPYLEIRSLIPIFASTVVIKGDITAAVRISKYSGLCVSNGNCSSLIQFNRAGIKSSNERTTCTNFQNGNFSDCIIAYTCTECTVEVSDASISFVSDEANSFGSGFIWNITSTAAYPKYDTKGQLQRSNLSSEIYSGPSTLFRGIRTLTEVSLALFESSYKVENGDTLTGYHFDFRDTHLGEQVNTLNFSFQNGIGFRFKFDKSLVSLEVSTQTKKEVVTILSELLGTIAGVIGIFITILITVEMAKSWWDFGWYFIYKRETTPSKYSSWKTFTKLREKVSRRGYNVSSDDEDDDRHLEDEFILGTGVVEKRKDKKNKKKVQTINIVLDK